MIRAIIFDMDGVLVDSEPLHFLAAKEVLDKYGYKFTDEIHKEIIGTTEHFSWQYIVRTLGIEMNYKKLMDEKADIYRALLAKQSRAIPGAIEFVQDTQVPKAIASSSPREEIDIVLDRFAITKSFKAIVSGDDVKKSKPDPEIYLRIAKKLELYPRQCIVIEDAINGVKAAKAAGMKCIALTTSFQKDKLRQADYIIDDFTQFKLEWLK